MKTSVCLVLFYLCCVTFVACRFISSHEVNKIDPIPQANTEWDFILYTTRWPAAVANGNSVPTNVTGFSLHGLWPNRNDTTWPQYCTNQQFDLKPIESLYSTLVEVWYDFEHPYDPSDFWSHEYEKHGTCAESDPLMASEYQFFSTAIKLSQNMFPLVEVLAKGGIVPSDSKLYNLNTFQQVIQNGIGAFPLMTCSQDYEGNVQVDRIQFCVSKSLQLYTCNSAVTNKIIENGNCGSGTISFPPIPR